MSLGKKIKYCELNCEYAELAKEEDIPGCFAVNPLYCSKHDCYVKKSNVCIDDLEKVKKRRFRLFSIC